MLPDGTTRIGSSMFYGCSELTSVSIPDSVEKISSTAFAGCKTLNNVTIPESVKYIYGYAFSECSLLTDDVFENPSGWRYSSKEEFEKGTEISSQDLSDPSVAAEYLRSKYADFYWERE